MKGARGGMDREERGQNCNKGVGQFLPLFEVSAGSVIIIGAGGGGSRLPNRSRRPCFQMRSPLRSVTVTPRLLPSPGWLAAAGIIMPVL